MTYSELLSLMLDLYADARVHPNTPVDLRLITHDPMNPEQTALHEVQVRDGKVVMVAARDVPLT